MGLQKTLGYWAKGIRLYIGLAIGLVTLEVLWWSQVVYGGSSLATIRAQEAFAWISLGLLTLALLIGPLFKAWPTVPAKQQLREARRLVGVGAAWFALLHASVVYIVQFHVSNPLHLPKLYQQSLLLGAIGLLALLALALTSFNTALKVMGIWWFRLHRFIYVTALAALMHAFMIGAHATGTLALVALASMAAIWVGLNLYFLLHTPNAASVVKIVTLSYGTVLLLAILNYGLTQHLGYNVLLGQHAETAESTTHQEHR